MLPSRSATSLLSSSGSLAARAASPPPPCRVNSVTIGGVAQSDGFANGASDNRAAPPAPASRTVAVRSIRDAEQGIYEYLEEKHPAQRRRNAGQNLDPNESPDPLTLRTLALPVRLSGWLWRREGLFRKYKRRFCVFRAEQAALFVFSDDDTVNGKLLRRLVLTRVTLTNRDERSFVAQGYAQDRELHKKDSDALTQRTRSSLRRGALPGDHQRFFLPEEERLKAVTAKACSVWAHCFKYHMRSYSLRRRRDSHNANNANDGNGITSASASDSEDVAVVSEDDVDVDVDEDELDPDFVFEDVSKRQSSQSKGARARSSSANPETRSKPKNKRRGRGVRAESDFVAKPRFDDEYGAHVRITREFSQPSTMLDAENASLAATVVAEGNQSRMDAVDASESSQDADDEQEMQALATAQMNSIWEDEELLSHRVDFDAIVKQERLAAGASGEIWRALYRSQEVAIKHLRDDMLGSAASTKKMVHRRRRALLDFVEEIRIMSRLEHNRIVVFRGVAWTMERDVLLVMEHLPQGDLRSYLGAIKRQEENSTGSSHSGASPKVRDRFRSVWTWTKVQWRLAIDIIEGLVYLHSLNPRLVHGDLKSRNVLLRSDLRAKLTDFGLSRYVTEPGDDDENPKQQRETTGDSLHWASQAFGTGRWMAPEMLKGGSQASMAADVYAFGVVLSEIDTCERPFYDREKQVARMSPSVGEGSGEDGSGQGLVLSEDVLVHQIVAEGWKPTFRVICPEPVKQLALECLVPDPKARPTSLAVAHRLRKAASQRERPEHLARAAVTHLRVR